MSREMKNSGIAWIGDIPKQWRIVRTKNIFNVGKELVGEDSSHTQLLSLTTKGIKQVEIGSTSGKVPDSYDTYQIVHKDNLVFCLFDLDCSAVFSGVSSYEGMISPAYKVLSMQKGYYPQYYGYWFDYIFDGRKYKYLSKNIRYSLTYDEFASLGIVAPSYAEQKAIADFLDKKCGEVDELVALQEKIIEELKSYKQSVITETVCKGLNPNVPMKDSGVEWIGDIPEGWKVMKIKHLASVVRGGSPRPAGDPQYYEGNIPFMKVADITKDDNIFVNDCEYTIKEAGLSHTRMIEPHTLLLTNSGATLGVPKINTFKTTFNDGIAAFLDLDKSLDIYFAYYSLKARTKYFLDSASLGIGQPNLNTDIIGSTYLAIPPIEEQYDIIEFLNTKCSEIDQLISIKQQKIVELKDYKKSLIYEYTTGKKEVKL